ncbi:MAG: sulfatase [Myxococcales bacterium]|nr:sulfatase [Myxococcales bacterium]
MSARGDAALGAATAGVVALELSGLAARGALPGAAAGLALTLLGSACVVAAAQWTLDRALGAVGRVGPLGRGAARASTGRARKVTLGLAVLGALAAHAVDAHVYVRLYPHAHLALGLATLLCAWAAARVAADAPGPRLPAWLLVPALLAAAHVSLQARADAKAALVADATVTTSLARVLSAATDLDRDGLGWLLTAADDAPLDGDAGGGCQPPVAAADDARFAEPPPLATAAPDPRAMDLLLIVVDAWRFDHAPGHPDGVERMPALARFAEGAAVFERAYAAAPSTMPSLYSAFAGRWPWAVAWAPTGITSANKVLVLDTGATWPRAFPGRKRVATPAVDRHPTLAALLRARGWLTATFPVQENLLRPFGLSRHFEVYDSRVFKKLNRSGLEVTGAATTDMALGFLASRPPDRPVFLWTHLYDPHRPYVVPPGVTAGSDDDLGRYRAEIRYTDAQIGRLLAALDASGRADRTVVVVMGDHGEEFGDHGGQFHSATLYDELIHVPLFVRVPGLPPTRVDQPVSLIDVAPTVLDALGLPPAETHQGRSLLPLLRGATLPPAPVFSETLYRQDHAKWAVVGERWKLIWDRNRGVTRLFDLAADPGERDNVADSHPGRAAMLHAALCEAFARTGGLVVAPRPPDLPDLP